MSRATLARRFQEVVGVAPMSYLSSWRLAKAYDQVKNSHISLDIIAQSQAGRLRLLALEFEDFEREVKRVLKGIWGAHGLDVDTDILAITVNRWPHGYARDLIDLEDPEWLAKPGPYEVGRQRFGSIAIANSDAGADAYTHTAIDQAWRAVQDLAEN